MPVLSMLQVANDMEWCESGAKGFGQGKRAGRRLGAAAANPIDIRAKSSPAGCVDGVTLHATRKQPTMEAFSQVMAC